MINIKIENNLIKYNLNLEHKLTFIRGMSATGKTYLKNTITEYLKDSPIIKIESPYKIVPLDTINFDLYIKNNNEKAIYLIDEDEPVVFKDKFIKFLNNCNGYIILILRDTNIPINCSIDNIYEFIYDENTNSNILTKYYNINQRENINYNKVYTEDSKSGNELFKLLIKDKEINSYNGNTNINNTIEKLDNILSIIDYLGFGRYINKYNNIVINKRIETLFIPCLEKLILDSSIIIEKSKIENIINEIELNSYNREKSYSILLSELSQKYKNRDGYYSKSKLNKLYKEEESLNKIKDELKSTYNFECTDLDSMSWC